MARPRRKAKKANPKHRRRARRARRANPRSRRRRRVHRNPRVKAGEAFVVVPAGSKKAVKEAVASGEVARVVKRRRRKFSKTQRRMRKRLFGRARSISRRWRGKPRSARKTVQLAQAHRMRALAITAPRKPGKSALAKALHLRTNPGIGGVGNLLKQVAPQAAAGGVGLVGSAWLGAKIGSAITQDATTKALRPSFVDATGQPKAVARYIPALSTVGVAVGGYALANKFAPKYKGAVVIGGLLGAVVQVITAAAASPSAVASAATGKPGLLSQIVAALTGQPALPSAVPVPNSAVPATAAVVQGLGDYTLIGGRGYAEGGMFREIGEYTTVGDAYSTARPRASRDNRMEWAATGGLSGADDATEFASGEGGVLSGGMFRGPSTR